VVDVYSIYIIYNKNKVLKNKILDHDIKILLRSVKQFLPKELPPEVLAFLGMNKNKNEAQK
jgi:hypothetical protein